MLQCHNTARQVKRTIFAGNEQKSGFKRNFVASQARKSR
ncbi:hypothetical protein CP97_02630 [Aurantiacibacter atlanticus]|uniref:Uncharacterized protein n=1 Tax=Aurantiacibacter atlanticus TaxID=1648404 RepID=A0A0H4VVU8_9SPHN|nr:hypothetical protein CP97_02630 [Aurantiacibacter atlanticus]